MNRKKDILLNQCLYAAIHAMLWGGHAVIIGFCSNFLKLAGFQDSMSVLFLELRVVCLLLLRLD